MEPIANKHVLINNTRIAHGIYGPRTGTPLILIHGTPSSSLIWRSILPRLVAAGYKVHLYDLLGYGVSERPWDVDTSISGQVPILEGLFATWGLDSAHIIAHDIGGGIAQRLAIFSPAYVRSLAMIDVVSFNSYPSKRTQEQMAAGLETLAKAPSATHTAHFRTWLLGAVHNPSAFETTSLDTYLSYITGPIGQVSLFEHQIRHYDPKHTMEIADRLGELGKMPVKIIWGADDAWQVVDWAYKLRDAIPGAELTVVQEAGHFCQEDQPERISELLLEFLGKQPAAA